MAPLVVINAAERELGEGMREDLAAAVAAAHPGGPGCLFLSAPDGARLSRRAIDIALRQQPGARGMLLFCLCAEPRRAPPPVCATGEPLGCGPDCARRLRERCASLAASPPLPELRRMHFARSAVTRIRTAETRAATRWVRAEPALAALGCGELVVATHDADSGESASRCSFAVLQIERCERYRLCELPHAVATLEGCTSVQRLRERLELRYPAIEDGDEVRVFHFATVHRLRGVFETPMRDVSSP
eukprot:TRINITY_DN26885_c0_g1_i1.p2 TRINITY_DN26885_c0_g1~~TRINITY_DN26885_c0_g1_i1.p2  ORF type:complete len:246 (+),score=65.47 TRINITY_DN26885_c0_g1_i1:115-852(+)